MGKRNGVYAAMLCELCRCEPSATFHHFIPRMLHSNKWFKKRYSREAMHAGMDLCRECHKTLHRAIGEKELGRHYNTRQKLELHPELAKYLAWKTRRHGRLQAGS